MTSELAATHWPETGNSERVAARLEEWNAAASAAESTFAISLADTSAGAAMLRCIFGASPFLSNCLIAEPDFVRKLWEEGVDECVHEAVEGLKFLPPGAEETDRQLRIARRRSALAIALADISDQWTVEQVTEALSNLADAAVSASLRCQIARLADRGVIAPPSPDSPEEGSGLIVLGLGKLGGRELNYSSDIDLVLLYDAEAVPAADSERLPRHLMRLARAFVPQLSDRTADGYAFRVDLRLRPDPSATPLVMSTEAAEHYYEARGQTWERAALIKARPVAGDFAAARRFLGSIDPFVWRRHLDFATVQELHDIKKKINAHHGSDGISIYGHNLKLGRGGIREIEFFAQTHQLIWGGKDRRLRLIPTCEALRALAATGRLPSEVASGFIDSYRFLRRAEHRVQMVDDEQTHSLPEGKEEFLTLSRFLGYAGEEEFSQDLLGHLRRVEEHYGEFFELASDATSTTTSPLDGPEEVERYRRLGFKDPDKVAETLAKWRSGRYRVAQGEKARELLDGLTPSLLIAMLGTHDPDLAIARFDGLLARLPTGLQVFALFQSNIHVMETVAEILVSAPQFAELLTSRPSLFETLLETGDEDVQPSRETLAGELALQLGAARDSDELVQRLRRWVDGARFRAGIHMLFGRLDALDAAPVFSDIAELALARLLPGAERDLARRHGRLPGSGAALLALGRLGSREMSISSDLDLVLVYDADDDAVSDGDKPLPASTWYNRLLRRLIAALRAQAGQIYDIDMRLRPSGNAGPLATSLAAFERYHQGSAWTWERMALTRARVVAGSPETSIALTGALHNALRQPFDLDRLRRDVAEMRLRMDGEYHTDNPWSIKHVRGGLVDVEFIVQYLQLHGATTRPVVGNTGAAIEALGRVGALQEEDAAALGDAWRLWSRLQALQRTIREDASGEDLPRGMIARVQSAADVKDLPALENRMDAARAAVLDIYHRTVATEQCLPSGI